MTQSAKIKRTKSVHNGRTALGLFAVAVGMVGLAFASEPLYRIFCQVTGYGGTTQVADTLQPNEGVLGRSVTVRFDANVNSKLPWQFKPVQREIEVRVGEQALAFFEATNGSNKPIVGTASFNVTPYKAAIHFNKIDCFCFTEQVLRPGQTVQMPVTFFVDPGLAKDKNASDVRTITLSYTFFQDEDQSSAKELAENQFKVREEVYNSRVPSRPEG